MNLVELLLTAVDTIRASKVRAFLTTLGVIIGVFAVILLVVLGRRIVQELFGEENPLGRMIKVADAEFRVIGLMEHKGNTLGFDLDDLVMIPETTALDLFGLDALTNLIVRARDKADMAAAIADITEVLRSRHNGQIDFTIMSNDD